jgi:hypothetical protein
MKNQEKKQDVLMLFRSGISIEHIGRRLLMDVETVIAILTASSLSRQLGISNHKS